MLNLVNSLSKNHLLPQLEVHLVSLLLCQQDFFPSLLETLFLHHILCLENILFLFHQQDIDLFLLGVFQSQLVLKLLDHYLLLLNFVHLSIDLGVEHVRFICYSRLTWTWII